MATGRVLVLIQVASLRSAKQAHVLIKIFNETCKRKGGELRGVVRKLSTTTLTISFATFFAWVYAHIISQKVTFFIHNFTFISHNVITHIFNYVLQYLHKGQKLLLESMVAKINSAIWMNFKLKLLRVC